MKFDRNPWVVGLASALAGTVAGLLVSYLVFDRFAVSLGVIAAMSAGIAAGLYASKARKDQADS